MDVKTRIRRVKEKIKKLKERKKHAGAKHIEGVSKPQKLKPKDVKAPKLKMKRPKKQVVTGPKGGQFIVSSGGRRDYKVGKSIEFVKSLVEEVRNEEKVVQFIDNFKRKRLT